MKPGVETYRPRVEHYQKGMEKNLTEAEATLGCNSLQNVHRYTGQFGYVTGFRDSVEPSCSIYPYEYSQAAMAQQQRYQQGMSQGSASESYRKMSGN
jgi:hypothetical protein